MNPLMVQGCTSDAGKSFLCAALCRHLANQGLSVAPFKAQNMSNNAAVTAAGLEMGRAQYLQAQAARVQPDVRMNPVLLKPTADTSSQTVVLGEVDHEVARLPWGGRRERLWEPVRRSLHGLIADHDVVVIEGAGSPAEVNLRAGDIVNMAVALEAQADVYLVSDIDRGGSFAHLLGTWHCLTPEERALLKGFVLNRFRGDPALLGDAPAWLEGETGVPVVAVVPYLRHRLPEEDALHHRSRWREGSINLALVAYPWASNLDEFDPLVHEEGVNVVPLREREELTGYDAILLPGSKNTVGSLQYLRTTGLAAELQRAARSGTKVVGVCGGMQLLGERILDPEGVEGGDAEGLGLLDLVTRFQPGKQTRQREVRWTEGGSVSGYEIHHGATDPGPSVEPFLEDGLGWRQGNVLGTYLHGLLENTAYRQRFLEGLGWSGQTVDWQAQLDAELECVARLVEESGWAARLDQS